MDKKNFTSSSPEVDDAELGQNIKSALIELRKVFINQEIKALQWNDNYVAIPLVLKIPLPTRGTVNNVDIRSEEPIFLLLEKQNYPFKAPLAWSNRRDFPKDGLPHLNPKPPGSPANFCLHRGSIDTWFSEHTITEFVERVQGWLSDAASDRLMREEDGFEATRIDDSLGYCIFEPAKIQKKVIEEWRSHHNRGGYCFISYRLINNPKKEPLVDGNSSYAIQYEYSVIDENLSKVLSLSKKINDLYTESYPIDRYLFGILMWPPKREIPQFFGELPGNFQQLLEFAEKIQFPLKTASNSYLSKDMHLLSGIPITFVIPRPRKILRSKSNLEFLTFLVLDDKWSKSLSDMDTKNTKVWPMRQRTPLTISLARDISSHPPEFEVGKLLFLGCGAVGSKFALHLVKSGGCKKMTFADYDDLSPHNLVRHGLLSESLGVNKAQAMKDVVEKIFYADKDSIDITAIKENIMDIFLKGNHDILRQHKWLIDATAAINIRDVLIDQKLPSSLSIARCEIADNGKLGFLSIEGPNRNPRLDDMLFYLYDLAIDNAEISNWLQSTKKQRDSNPETNLEEIGIGISCSSETMRLGDDSVSFHTSLFSLGFNKKCIDTRSRGFLQISCNDLSKSTCYVHSHEIAPVSILRDEFHKNWEIRITASARAKIMECLRASGRNETGGLLIGQIDSKNKRVYITRILTAPPDSRCWPYAFERGVLDVPEDVKMIREKTGGMIDYVGEWHTHPGGGKRLSATDHDAVRKIRKVLDPALRPTMVMIVTKDGVYPYIFSSEG